MDFAYQDLEIGKGKKLFLKIKNVIEKKDV